MKMDGRNFRPSTLQNMTSAFFGAVLTSLTMTPLDVVKTRLQVDQGNIKAFYFYCNGLTDHLCPSTPTKDAWYRRPSKFSGTLDGILKITRHEGLFSLWSGLGPTLVLALPTTVFYFALFEEIRFIFQTHCSNGQEQSLWIPFVSASTSRSLTTFISSPLELIRTKMQAQRMSYLDVHRATQNLINFEGFTGLWKGVSATVVRDGTFSGLYWLLFEAVRPILDPDNELTLTTSFLAGTTAGAVSAAVTTPFDVVKTHMQLIAAEEIVTELPARQQIGMYTVFGKIYAENGLRGIFSGLVPRTIRIAPSCAIMISTFEYGKSYFEAFNKKHSQL